MSDAIEQHWLQLNWREVAVVFTVAGQRRTKALALKIQDSCFTPSDGDYERIEVRGAAAEMALAKWLDRFWHGASYGIDGSSDVADCQVRFAPFAERPLCVYRKDEKHADQPFVLVHVTEKYHCTFKGWVYGWEALEPARWLNPGEPMPGGWPGQKVRFGAFFTASELLKPMDTLPALRA